MSGEHERRAAPRRAATRPAARGAADPAPRGELRAILAGRQADSWCRLPTTPSTEPVLVGRIFFATRDTVVDAHDDEVLRQIARAYAARATRNVGTPGAELGLVGQVVGHADPRPSLKPDNDRLSEQRAFWVAQRLVRHLVQATGLAESCFRIDWSGAGVTRPVAEQDEAAAGEDTMAALRFADVLLAGEANAAGGTAPVAPDPESLPPKLKPWPPSDLPRWEQAVASGQPRAISAMARSMLGPSTLSVDEVLDWAARFTGQEMRERKPPWWDGRTAGLGASQGRNAARNELHAKAALLLRDYVETMKWQERHLGPGGSLPMLVQELRKDRPDPATLETHRQNLAYLNFMMNQTQDLAVKVEKLATR